MLFWLFQQIIISLVVIVLIHSIYKFLQNNLTTPKIRDLVNKPTKEYDEIYKTINSSNMTDLTKNPNGNEAISSSSMKNELQNYLKELNSSETQHSSEPQQRSENNIVQNTVIEGGTFSNNFSAAYQTL